MLLGESTTNVVGLVLVAVVSGAGGALLTTFLQTHHEREERLRERMITAAHDLLTSVAEASISLRLIIAADRATPDDMPAADAALKDLRRQTDDAASRQPLIPLLFGQDSDAAKESRFLVDAMRVALLEAENASPDIGEADIYEDQAAEHFGDFISAVHERVAAPRPWYKP